MKCENCGRDIRTDQLDGRRWLLCQVCLTALRISREVAQLAGLAPPSESRDPRSPAAAGAETGAEPESAS